MKGRSYELSAQQPLMSIGSEETPSQPGIHQVVRILFVSQGIATQDMLVDGEIYIFRVYKK